MVLLQEDLARKSWKTRKFSDFPSFTNSTRKDRKKQGNQISKGLD